jgi:peptidoglycan/LPS O-acetylase OafA/YrhL
MIIYLIGCGLVLVFNLFPFQYFFNDLGFLFIATFFGRCFEFFVGIGLSLLYLKFRKDFEKPGLRFFNYTYLGLALIILNLFIMEEISRHLKVQHATMVWQGILVANFFLPVCIALFFWGLATERSVINGILSSRVVVLLGKSSYAFYLISAGFIAYTIHKHMTSHILGLLILLLLSSVALYFFVERILYTWIVTRLLDTKTEKEPACEAIQ